MSAPRYAERAARLLRQTGPTHGSVAGDRERGLSTIERALEARRPSRRPARIGVAASVAASVLGWLVLREPGAPPARGTLVSVVASPLRDGASFLDSTGEVPLAHEVSLLVGGRITTAPGGGARLQLSTGTGLELASATTLTLQSQDALQRFALAQGGLAAKVAKLTAHERFVIDTPDAQVEVRGTAFHLEVLPTPRDCGDRTRTRLEVTEGVVELRSSRLVARVAAGQHWPSDCDPPPSAAVPAVSGGEAAPGSEASGPPVSRAVKAAPARSVTGVPSRPQPPTASLIGEQNALFQRGILAQRRGDAAGALAAYGELIERFPSSPLAENAAVERIRLAVDADPSRARREAAAYLARYPRGFARVEMRRIAGEP
jgi:FecR-like protein